MIRRFVPPAVAAFGDGADADLAHALAQARDDGFAEGREVGQREGHAAGLREGETTANAAHQTELAALQERSAKHQATAAVTAALVDVLDARSADRQTLEDATRIGIVAALRMLFPTLLEQTAAKPPAFTQRRAGSECGGKRLERGADLRNFRAGGGGNRDKGRNKSDIDGLQCVHRGREIVLFEIDPDVGSIGDPVAGNKCTIDREKSCHRHRNVPHQCDRPIPLRPI